MASYDHTNAQNIDKKWDFSKRKPKGIKEDENTAVGENALSITNRAKRKEQGTAFCTQELESTGILESEFQESVLRSWVNS